MNKIDAQRSRQAALTAPPLCDTGEMAQAVPEHEDLNPHMKPGMVAHACNPGAGQVRTEGSLELTDQLT